MHDVGKQISFIKTCRPAHRRWKVVQVLIIDEGEQAIHVSAELHMLYVQPRRLTHSQYPWSTASSSTPSRLSLWSSVSRRESRLAEFRYGLPKTQVTTACGNLVLCTTSADGLIYGKLIVTGDFFQLPPVTPAGKEVCFAFQSSAWKPCIEHTIALTQVFRQKESRKYHGQHMPRLLGGSAGAVIRKG